MIIGDAIGVGVVGVHLKWDIVVSGGTLNWSRSSVIIIRWMDASGVGGDVAGAVVGCGG